jgi:hypothetical protein
MDAVKTTMVANGLRQFLSLPDFEPSRVIEQTAHSVHILEGMMQSSADDVLKAIISYHVKQFKLVHKIYS